MASKYSDRYRTLVAETIKDRGHINDVTLALAIMSQVEPVKFDLDLFQEALEYLVTTGEVIELEFVLPNLSYKIKSIYFPKGTILELRSPESAEKKEETSDSNRVTQETEGI